MEGSISVLASGIEGDPKTVFEGLHQKFAVAAACDDVVTKFQLPKVIMFS